MSPPRPSGPGWEKYQKEERAHWKKHGKSSGKYHHQHGQRWKLDRKAEAGKPIRFSPKSVDVKNQESRDHTSKREKKIKAQTSKHADKSLANAKRAKINSQGKEHHHNAVVDRVDKGLTTKYGGKIPEHVHKKHNKVGVYFGDDRRNFMAADPKLHKLIHKQYKALDSALKALDDTQPHFLQSKAFSMGRTALRASVLSLAPDILEMINERTDGAIDNTINKGVEHIKHGISNGVNTAVDAFSSLMPPQGGSNVDYGQ